ncbi:MAG TPA: matrixin family metalloprotease [Bryobacteraceae bacterium]|nr:matrixin family metalloprotease [Bryobacteraceae bacterium]
MKPLFATFFAACLLSAETFTYWIEPCAPAEAECEASDEQLAAWAMQAWQGVSEGGLSFAKSPKAKARIRLYWSSHGNPGLYGEARGILVDGKPGAEILVRPSLVSLGPQLEAAGAQDKLLRHTVVYLTCLHELGHALGMPHTRSFADIMYSFQYGGDIPEYFLRYRRKLKTLDDIQVNSGLSAGDEKRLLSFYKRP